MRQVPSEMPTLEGYKKMTMQNQGYGGYKEYVTCSSLKRFARAAPKSLGAVEPEHPLYHHLLALSIYTYTNHRPAESQPG